MRTNYTRTRGPPNYIYGGTMEDKSKQQDTIGDYALRLAGKGYNVLPLCWPTKDGKCACGRQHDTKNVGKAPLSTKGVKNATTDENKIRGWWKRWAEANVGIALAPSNLVMVDPDSPEALAEVEGLGLQPTLTRESRNTAFLYRVPEGTPTIRTTVKAIQENWTSSPMGTVLCTAPTTQVVLCIWKTQTWNQPTLRRGS